MKKIGLVLILSGIYLMSMAQIEQVFVPVDQSEFDVYLEKIHTVKSPVSKIKIATELSNSKSFTCHQIKEISSFLPNDQAKLKFSLKAYKNAINPKDYYVIMDSFDMLSSAFRFYDAKDLKKKPKPEAADVDVILEYTPDITEKPVIIEHPNLDCFVGARELDEIIEVLNEESFENTRISSAKQIIKLKQCFRTEQIIRILKCFDYESSKQELAKFAFPYVTDKTYYYKVKEVFEFNTSIEDLDEFLDHQE